MAISRMTDTQPSAKREAPQSVRFSRELLATLHRLRGDLSLNAFIVLLVERALKAINRPLQSSATDRETLAQVLAILGRSELTTTARELVKALASGSLPVTPDTAKDIRELSTATSEILRLLLKALNVRSGA